MRTFFRGTKIPFQTIFYDSDGAVITTSAATITINSPLDGFPLENGTYTATYDMTQSSSTWTYNWDSADSGPGNVYWQIVASSTSAATEDGELLLRSNPAATWLNGPSAQVANDE